MFHLEKRKIFHLYRYYLFEKEQELSKLLQSAELRQNENKDWFELFLGKEKELKVLINDNLREDWKFDNLPVLEKAILFFGIYNLSASVKKQERFLIVDQIVNFSKAYLDKEKYKYINKNLDLFIKNKLDSFS